MRGVRRNRKQGKFDEHELGPGQPNTVVGRARDRLVERHLNSALQSHARVRVFGRLAKNFPCRIDLFDPRLEMGWVVESGSLEMRRRNHTLDLLPRHFAERLQRLLQCFRAVVYAGYQVTMKVNHRVNLYAGSRSG